MSSIYDLKTTVEELSSAHPGTSRMEYDQHPPTRDITGNNFPNGAIHFRFQTSGMKWWLPSRSYIRMRCSLTKVGGGQLDKNDDVAPNMGLCASLFQSAEFRVNDKTISRISDFMPQVDAIETRLSKSRSWLNGVGDALNFWGDDFKARQAAVCSNGVLIRELTDETLNNPTSEAYSRANLSFDAAGGTGADRNAASYTEATGRVVFSLNGGAALPGDVGLVYPIGSYFEYTAIQGATSTDSRLKKPAKVVAHINATTIQVETGVIGADVASDGRTDFIRVDVKSAAVSNINVARKVKEFEIIWQPPLSVFKLAHALPSGKFELVLNPQTSSVYKDLAIQSSLSNKVAGTDFDFAVNDMYFYCNTVEGPRADDITYLLDLEQTNCQSEQFSAGQTSFQQKNFDVSPSTYALTVAYQDTRSNSDSRVSSSQFKVSDAAYTSNSEELNLNRFFINYAGQNLPSPDADPTYTAVNDYTTQRYAESLIYTGCMFDTGGGESLYEWHKRGAYYYFAWPRDGTDRSTRVNVHNQFATSTDTANMRMLLFSHSKQVARVRVVDGRVVQVDLEDA